VGRCRIRPVGHHALDDAVEWTEIFANFLWKGSMGKLFEERRSHATERIHQPQAELKKAEELCKQKLCVYHGIREHLAKLLSLSKITL
jgi:hypothetical protein